MRIAHITDLHLRHHTAGHAAIPRRRSREAAELLADALADARRRGADVLALTGDLVDVPNHLSEPERDTAHDSAAWASVQRDYRLIRAMLDDSNLPWIALPGNHDNHRLLEEELGGPPYVRDIAGVRFVSFWDREHRHNVPRRMGRERARFNDALTDIDRSPQVHLQHYVITPELNQRYPHTYLEGAELRRRMAASERVALCLSGHYHKGTDPVRDGVTTFAVTPALAEAPHPYRIYDVPTDIDPHADIMMEQVELGRSGPRPAVFIDRDGCINTLASYRGGPEHMEILPRAAAGLRALHKAGYLLVVVTNQSCVGLGYVSPVTLNEVNDRMCELLADEGAAVDAIYASQGAGDRAVHPSLAGDDTAKPSPAMLHRAADELTIDMDASYLIGDRPNDIIAGLAAGVTPILVRTGEGDRTAASWSNDDRCTIVDDLSAAAEMILDRHRSVTGESLGMRPGTNRNEYDGNEDKDLSASARTHP